MALGIATGKARRGVDHLLERTGWRDCFRTVQTADGHPSKPAPDMILAAMAETGATPAATYMIGDTSFDMAMAASGGRSRDRRRLGLSQPGRTDPAGAERIVADFAELRHLIEA